MNNHEKGSEPTTKPHSMEKPIFPSTQLLSSKLESNIPRSPC